MIVENSESRAVAQQRHDATIAAAEAAFAHERDSSSEAEWSDCQAAAWQRLNDAHAAAAADFAAAIA